MTPLHRNEQAWIEHIRALWGRSRADVGPGDDACVLAPRRRAVSTDILLEGVDFELDWAPPAAVGYKALASNLSDLAAMGAKPEGLLLTLGWPETLEDAYVEGLLEGMRGLALQEGVDLLGGDLTRAPRLLVAVTIFGLQEHPPMLRSGGEPGDLLCVSGTLGGPAAALERFQSGHRLSAFGAAGPSGHEGQRVLDRFFRPPSQTAMGLFLAERGLATCCMDVSDGLARDLRRLCESSRCGAEVEEAAIPMDLALAGEPRDAAIATALRGGEEQILLFAVDPGRANELEGAPGFVHSLGHLQGEGGLWIIREGGCREALAEPGYDHFLA